MAYQKHNWVNKEIIKADQLNHIENGIYQEEQRAAQAEEILNQSVGNEVTRASGVEDSLGNRITQNTQAITTLNADENTPGSVDYKINEAIGGGGGTVSGVKGANESNYSTGNVELTPDKIGSVSFLTDAQELTTAQKENARTNIGAGTSDFDGDYDSLTNQPSIPGGVKIGTSRANAVDTTLYFIRS